MQTNLISIAQLCRAVRRSPPYVRALADSGAIDSFYVPATGWRAFPTSAIGQIKAHERERRLATADTHHG